MGQKASSVAQVVQTLESHGALYYSVVVCASAADSAALQYVAPYAACALRLELAQYREMEVFTQFPSDLDDMERSCPGLCASIDSTGLISDEDRQTILERAGAFTKGWLETGVS